MLRSERTCTRALVVQLTLENFTDFMNKAIEKSSAKE